MISYDALDNQCLLCVLQHKARVQPRPLSNGEASNTLLCAHRHCAFNCDSRGRRSRCTKRTTNFMKRKFLPATTYAPTAVASSLYSVHMTPHDTTCTTSTTPHTLHHPPHTPHHRQDFTNDRLVAEATLTTRLGTLRYLKQLQTTRRQALGAAPASAEGEQQSMCPVCHEALGRELVMLSCGHQLCAPCSMKMLEKLPKQIPKVWATCRPHSMP